MVFYREALAIRRHRAAPSLGTVSTRRQSVPRPTQRLDVAKTRLLRWERLILRARVKKNMPMSRHTLAASVVSIMWLSLSACATSPPVQEMSDARQAISAAEQADAARLAPVPLGDARRFLAEAEGQLKQEAYGLARMNAVRAKNRAVQALQATEAVVDRPEP
jgi:Domain of unknown function (DUF4398)